MIAAILIWLIDFVLIILNWLKSKKIRLFPSLMLVIFILFFELIKPTGKVLLAIRDFSITSGALLLGLRKSGILVGMIFLSKFIVGFDIRFSGRTGEFLKEVFHYFDLLTATKLKLNPKNFIEKIDERLNEIWKECDFEEKNIQKSEDDVITEINYSLDVTGGPCHE